MPDETRLPNDPRPGRAYDAEAELPSDKHARTDDGAELPPTRAGSPPPKAGAPNAEKARSRADGSRADGSLADRLEQATASGSLHGTVPAAYEDRDWETVTTQDNPFAVLYLDYRQPGAISTALLDERLDTLRRFWKEKSNAASRAGNRDRIEGKYKPEVHTYADKIVAAHLKLSAPGAVAVEAAKLDAARRAAGEAQIAELAELALDDGLLTVKETTRVLRQGESAGLTREEAADYLRRLLVDRGFRPVKTPIGTTVADTLLSTDWIDGHLPLPPPPPPPPPVGDPLSFKHGKAHTLPELVALCDKYPSEAKDYLADKELIEDWLGRRGFAAAKSAAGRHRTWDQERRPYALELFVREVRTLLGEKPIPVIVAKSSKLAFDNLPAGAARHERLGLVRSGRPLVWGNARTKPLLAGLSIQPSFESNAQSETTTIGIDLDTSDLGPGTYSTRLVIEPVGGEVVEIPLQFTVVPLTLTPTPPALKLGGIAPGQKRSATVHVRVSPVGGRLTGHVRLDPAPPGVALKGEVRDDGCDAQITIDARLAAPNVPYECGIVFETSAGTLRVPVTFQVRRAADTIRMWAGGLGVVSGIGMWIARDELGPAASWQTTYPGLPHEVSVLLSGAVITVIGVVATKVGRAIAGR